MGIAHLHSRRWLFIIDGIFTIPVALAGFLLFPGIPDSPKAFYLTDDEIALAKARLVKAKVTGAGKLDLNVFKRTLSRWHIWVFVFCYMQVTFATGLRRFLLLTDLVVA
jgi:ACS family pantothenate transporter-like MFS transporter